MAQDLSCDLALPLGSLSMSVLWGRTLTVGSSSRVCVTSVPSSVPSPPEFLQKIPPLTQARGLFSPGG